MDPDTNDMTSMNVSLPEALWRFANDRASGSYGSTSEYVRELIRADQRRADEEKLESLLTEGLESGEPIDASPKFWERKRQELAERDSRNNGT